MEFKAELPHLPEVKKPDVLFHASWNTHIDRFEPRKDTVRDPLEGPVVFATPDKAYASCFLVPTDDSWVKIGRYTEDGVTGSWKVVVSNEQRFRKLDRGGAIYHLPAESFSFHPQRNIGEIEWTSTDEVTPTGKEIFASGLGAMQENGVDVYFVDQQTFERIRASNDHGKSIIETLNKV
jgi:hypothetical protein